MSDTQLVVSSSSGVSWLGWTCDRTDSVPLGFWSSCLCSSCCCWAAGGADRSWQHADKWGPQWQIVLVPHWDNRLAINRTKVQRSIYLAIYLSICLSIIPHSSEGEGRLQSPVYCRAITKRQTIIHTHNLELPINLTCMSMDCGRKVEYISTNTYARIYMCVCKKLVLWSIFLTN